MSNVNLYVNVNLYSAALNSCVFLTVATEPIVI